MDTTLGRYRDPIMKQTHIETVRQRNAAVRMQVLNLLGWDDMRYAQFQEQMGLAWVEAKLTDTYIASEIVKHREFWSWWRMHWVRRDMEFVDMASYLFPSEIEEYYLSLHKVEEMMFFPHARVMNDTYEHMIHRLIKEAVK